MQKPFCHEELFADFKECDDFCIHCVRRHPTLGKFQEFKWKGLNGNEKGRWKSFQNLTTTDDFWDWAHSIILPGKESKIENRCQSQYLC